MTAGPAVRHDRFTLERVLPAPPERAFRAFADPARKARWFAVPDDWSDPCHELDLRVGGRERNRGTDPAGRAHDFRATYHVVEPPSLLVYSYELHVGGALASVSVATVELRGEGTGTRLVLTEQGVFIGGADPRDRRHGTGRLLDGLAAALATP